MLQDSLQWDPEFPGIPRAVEEHQECARGAGRWTGFGIRVKFQTQSGELDLLSSPSPAGNCFSQILVEGMDFIPCLNHPDPLEMLGAAQLQTHGPLQGVNSRGRRWEGDFKPPGTWMKRVNDRNGNQEQQLGYKTAKSHISSLVFVWILTRHELK